MKTLYDRAKYVSIGTVGGESLPIREVLALPDQSLTLTRKAAVNAVLAVDAPVVTLETSVDQLSVRVDTLSKNFLAVGGTATIQAQGSTATRTGTITTISEFRDLATEGTGDDTGTGASEAGTGTPPDAESATFPGFDIGLTIDFSSDANPWNPGAVLVIQFDVAAEPYAAVPLTAIREDGTQAHVYAKRDSEFVKVPIEVTDQSDGWALIAANDNLALGDTVRISP